MKRSQAHRNFRDRVHQLLAEEVQVKMRLWHEGQQLVERCCGDGKMSLRELARRTGLSPTYLSQVRTRKSVVSPSAFVKIWDAIENT